MLVKHFALMYVRWEWEGPGEEAVLYMQYCTGSSCSVVHPPQIVWEVCEADVGEETVGANKTEMTCNYTVKSHFNCLRL